MGIPYHTVGVHVKQYTRAFTSANHPVFTFSMQPYFRFDNGRYVDMAPHVASSAKSLPTGLAGGSADGLVNNAPTLGVDRTRNEIRPPFTWRP